MYAACAENIEVDRDRLSYLIFCWLFASLMPGVLLQVDGGINSSTIVDAVAAGANIIVAGTYIFGSKDISSTIGSMKHAFQLS